MQLNFNELVYTLAHGDNTMKVFMCACMVRVTTLCYVEGVSMDWVMYWAAIVELWRANQEYF